MIMRVTRVCENTVRKSESDPDLISIMPGICYIKVPYSQSCSTYHERSFLLCLFSVNAADSQSSFDFWDSQ